MTDDDLVDYIANVWIKNGGDSEGIVWCWKKIFKAVKNKEETAQEDFLGGESMV